MSREIVYQLGDVEVVAYTGTAGTGTAQSLNRGVEIRVYATSDCHITTNGTTATANDTPLTSGVPEYLYLPAGHAVSVIQSSAGGNLFITKLSY